MGCRTENVRSRGRTSAKTLIRVMANGRENRECKKSKKQLRKRRTTLCNGKGSHPSWGLERSATSVSHQDSGIKTLTKPHSSLHLSLSSTSIISPLALSLQGQRSRPLQVSRTSPPGEPADSETRCVPQGRVQMCFMHAVSCADLYVVPGISTPHKRLRKPIARNHKSRHRAMKRGLVKWHIRRPLPKTGGNGLGSFLPSVFRADIF